MSADWRFCILKTEHNLQQLCAYKFWRQYKHHSLITHYINDPVSVIGYVAGISITFWPIRAWYQPDTIRFHRWAGRRLIFSANEGDAKNYDHFSETSRGNTMQSELTCLLLFSSILFYVGFIYFRRFVFYVMLVFFYHIHTSIL